MKASLSNEFSGFVGCKKERSSLCLRHCHLLILRQPARRTIFLLDDCENSIMLQGGNRVRRLGLRVVVTSSGIYHARLPPIFSNRVIKGRPQSYIHLILDERADPKLLHTSASITSSLISVSFLFICVFATSFYRKGSEC